jgi:hypothetical protein
MACGGLPIGATTFFITQYTPDASSGVAIGSPFVGKSYHITDMVVSSELDNSIRFEDSDSTIMIDDMGFPAVSIWSKTWMTPMVLAEGTNLVCKSGVAGNITVTISGYFL